MSFLDNCKKIILKYLLLPILMLNAQLVFANNSKVYIENIDLKNHGLLIKFSGKPAFQTIQIDDYQILIALKGILSDHALDNHFKKSDLIKQVSFDKMAGDVTALVVYTNKEVKSYSSNWLDNENSLFLKFAKI